MNTFGLISLKVLYLQNNHLGCADSPDLSIFWQSSAWCSMYALTNVNLSNNSLVGPTWYFQMCFQLEYLELNNNKLSGDLSGIANLYNLKVLNLENNRVSSYLFPGLGSMSKCYWLTLGNNAFTGSLEVLYSMTALTTVTLSFNQFHDEVDFLRLGKLPLFTLTLNGNPYLTGFLPETWGA